VTRVLKYSAQHFAITEGFNPVRVSLLCKQSVPKHCIFVLN